MCSKTHGQRRIQFHEPKSALLVFSSILLRSIWPLIWQSRHIKKFLNGCYFLGYVSKINAKWMNHVSYDVIINILLHSNLIEHRTCCLFLGSSRTATVRDGNILTSHNTSISDGCSGGIMVGALGAFVPTPRGRLCSPTCAPVRRKKNGKNQPFLTFLPLQTRILPPIAQTDTHTPTPTPPTHPTPPLHTHTHTHTHTHPTPHPPTHTHSGAATGWLIRCCHNWQLVTSEIQRRGEIS